MYNVSKWISTVFKHIRPWIVCSALVSFSLWLRLGCAMLVKCQSCRHGLSPFTDSKAAPHNGMSTGAAEGLDGVSVGAAELRHRTAPLFHNPPASSSSSSSSAPLLVSLKVKFGKFVTHVRTMLPYIRPHPISTRPRMILTGNTFPLRNAFWCWHVSVGWMDNLQ